MIQRKNAPPPNILWFNASNLQCTSILQHIRRSKKLTACHQRVTVLLQFHVIYKSNKKPIQIATQKKPVQKCIADTIHAYLHIDLFSSMIYFIKYFCLYHLPISLGERRISVNKCCHFCLALHTHITTQSTLT